MRNRSGPNIDPCGTPYETVRESANMPFIEVFCCLLVKFNLNLLRYYD